MASKNPRIDRNWRDPIRRSDRWLQELAKKCGRPYNRLLIALRGEEGEENGRFHFHCLVGGTLTRNYHTLAHQAEWLWKIQTAGAHVDVRQYDRSLAGAEYVVKCLGANNYELNKFSFANTVTLSSSIYRLIAAMDRVYERRRRLGHMKNRGGDELPSASAGSVAVPA
ncbi:MAG TPA: hypothetical protein VGO59_05360 [Verrucomicrobiae bacterium]|jgi:hypothetical protein